MKIHFLSENEEAVFGVSTMPHMPRIGETVWIQNNKSKMPQLDMFVCVKIIDVAYWVPNHEGGFNPQMGCSEGVAYVKLLAEAK